MRMTVIVAPSVLHLGAVRELLLWLAYAEFYGIRWTTTILNSMRQRIIAEQPYLDWRELDTIVALMRDVFPAADLIYDDEPEWISRSELLQEDRHVLAAALAGRVNVIATMHPERFRATICSPLGITAQTPDDLACWCLKEDYETVLETLFDQADTQHQPTRTPIEVIAAVKPIMPRFAEGLSRYLGEIRGDEITTTRG